MTDNTVRDEVLAIINQEIAGTRAEAAAESDLVRQGVMARHARIREEVAEEEAQAIAEEIAESRQTAGSPSSGDRISRGGPQGAG